MTKKVLVFSDWFVPGFKAGGPIRSLANLIQALPDVSFTVVTRITDYHSSESYPGIQEGVWRNVFSNCKVLYLNDTSLNRTFIRELIQSDSFDFIYLNSLFSPTFTIKPLLVIRSTRSLSSKVIIAPRGMLKSGALSVKPWKKQLFIKVAKAINLFRNTRWHATTAIESGEIRGMFGKNVEVKVAEVLPTLLRPIVKADKRKNSIKLVCFSRVSAEKGILEAIEYVNEVPNEYSVSLDIYGSIPQGDYSEKCLQEAERSPDARVKLMGEVNPAELEKIYANYHGFILPTWGENFGHAIAESLMTGTPVIISDKTPWRNLAQSKCGLDIPLNKESFIKAIIQFAQMDHVEWSEWSENAARYGATRALDKNIIDQHIRLFE